ncbi:hypothetical protein L9F63_010983, partial [Diploptera punctata]
TLHNLNFETTAGTNVAFVDVNGKASTSIMDILLGFYEPASGKVLFEGIPQYPLNMVAVISFNPQLFSCLSVLDNIQIGLKDIEFDQILQVCIDTGVHGYIPGLSLGYDTLVGENFAVDLKQRIVLARTAIRNPTILIIDDITSQHTVDIQGNRSLIEAFHKVMDSCTTVVFSQRLPIIQHANKICILEILLQNGTEEKQRKMTQFIFEPEFLNQAELPHVGRCSMVCLNSPEWPWIALGLISHIITGLGLPACARLFGDIFVPREELPRTSQFWGYMILIVGSIVGVSFWLQVTAPRICEVVGACTSMFAAMVAAFLHGWKMELVLLLVFPALAFAFHIKTRTIVSQQQHQYKLMKPANQIMAECLQKIRTLRILGGEEMFEKLYAKKLTEPYLLTRKHATIYAVVYALAESGVHVLYAASFKFGFFLIQSQHMGLVSVYRIFFPLGICIISMSHLLIYRQEWINAQDTLQNLFKLVRSDKLLKNQKIN